ncbi:phage tail protein [Leclercia adecarboxylata]|uniref:phage tail protein n=1 Tax=Leclercia adecarboxylata TaxID=83655 RepID=UPI002DBD07F7|nr:phage tail protein [Leclercia adecarboxylata]MEB5748657.1 phage tail protein [Leclercia adecarboxylata]
MAEKKNALKGVADEQKIYAVLTDRGAELEAAALASGVPVRLKQFVIGDANGEDEVTPDPSRTALIHEVYRSDIHGATSAGNQVTFTLDVPTETGGYTIREVGILTEEGELYSVARSPDILKPTESNGAVISVTYKYTLAVSSTSTVSVIVYNDYLTPEAADKKYLQIENNFSEIAARGNEAKNYARNNLDVYSREEVDDKSNRAVKTVNGTGPDAQGNINVETGKVKTVNGNGPDAAGNVNAGTVRSVNGVGPDANGNVNVATTPSGNYVTGFRLGAQSSALIPFVAPAGCVLTGYSGVEGDRPVNDTMTYRPMQQQINGGAWVTVPSL